MGHQLLVQMASALNTVMLSQNKNLVDIAGYINRRKRRRQNQLLQLQNLALHRPYIPRQLWLKAKSTGWYDFVVPQMSASDFNQHFRMSREVFGWLVDLLEPLMQKKNTYFRQAIDVRKRISIGLKCLSSCAELKEMAALFGVGVTTAQECFQDFVHAVNTLLAKNIRWPTSEAEFRQKAEVFENLWQFPMTVAAIDGCHFPVTPPRDRTTDYYNFKGWYSMIAFAACDAEGKVLFVKVGTPGRANDSTVFRSSSLHNQINDNNCLPDSNRFLHGVKIPFHILGDSAFRLDSWCLKPFAHRTNLNDDQRRFNARLSRARRIIGNVFGRVKGRWRRVLKRIEVDIENAAAMIHAAFIMHDFCEMNNAYYDDIWDEEIINEQTNFVQPEHIEIDANMNPNGEQVRNALVAEFALNPLGYNDM